MIQSTAVVRRVDELGRVTLPAEIRELFNIKEKDKLEIRVDKENGYIILQKRSQMPRNRKFKGNHARL